MRLAVLSGVMEAAPQGSPASASEVALLIKNPGRNAPDFQLKLSRGSTVADVKARLAEAYAGTPAPATQTVGVIQYGLCAVLLAKLQLNC